MPSLAAAKASSSALALSSPTALFVGGTQGIGGGMAIALAKYSQSPTIHIVGRNQEAANRMLEELRIANKDGTYAFHQCDVSLMSESKSLADKLQSQLPKLNFLVLSPGILTMQGRTETSEGLDNKMALHFYSRFLFARTLLGNLQTAAEKGEPARVMSVLDGKRGNPSTINWNDLDLKTSFSLAKAADHCLTFTDIVYQRFAEKNPSIGFIHAYPGLVNSNLGKQNPWYLKAAMWPLMKTVSVSTQNAGEWLFSGLTSPATATGLHFMDDHGDLLAKKPTATPEQVETVWNHAEKMINV